MSDHLIQDLDGLDFEDRTTKDTFNERLLRAKENNNYDLDDCINFDDFYSEDTELLKIQLEKIKEQVDRMETKVIKMEEKLKARKERRSKEASLTNLSPEERAERVIQQEEEGDNNIPDLDVIFEYILLLGSSLSDDANDLSKTDFLKPHAGIRKKALENELVTRQAKYSSLRFTGANNKLESDADGEGEIRHCELAGTAHDQEFHLTFDVLEPSMVMSNLVFEVDIEMQLDIGDVLEKQVLVKEECDILSLFNLLAHYGQLQKERKQIFDNIVNLYANTPVNVDMLSKSRLKFEGGVDNEFYLILQWRTVTRNTDRYRLDANVIDHIEPVLSLEFVAQPSVIEKDKNAMLGKFNEKFLAMVKLHGVYNATETVINKIFRL